MYVSSYTCSRLYFLGQTLASALGSGCPVAPWNICLISQSSSLLAASLCRRFLHAAAALALHLSSAADLPVPAASLNAETTINGPSSYLRRCSLRQHSKHFVNLRSPFARQSPGRRSTRSGLVPCPIQGRLKRSPTGFQGSTLPSASSFWGELVPYVSKDDLASG